MWKTKIFPLKSRTKHRLPISLLLLNTFWNPRNYIRDRKKGIQICLWMTWFSMEKKKVIRTNKPILETSSVWNQHTKKTSSLLSAKMNLTRNSWEKQKLQEHCPFRMLVLWEQKRLCGPQTSEGTYSLPSPHQNPMSTSCREGRPLSPPHSST